MKKYNKMLIKVLVALAGIWCISLIFREHPDRVD